MTNPTNFRSPSKFGKLSNKVQICRISYFACIFWYTKKSAC